MESGNIKQVSRGNDSRQGKQLLPQGLSAPTVPVRVLYDFGQEQKNSFFPQKGTDSSKISTALRGSDNSENDFGFLARMNRTSFSDQQLKMLEACFKKTWYPSKSNKELIANRTNLSIKHINIWFQNRRSKQKRLNDDVLIEKYLGKGGKVASSGVQPHKQTTDGEEKENSQKRNNPVDQRQHVTGKSSSQGSVASAHAQNPTQVPVIKFAPRSPTVPANGVPSLPAINHIAALNGFDRQYLPPNGSWLARVGSNVIPKGPVSVQSGSGPVAAGDSTKEGADDIVAMCKDILRQSDAMLANASLWAPHESVDVGRGNNLSPQVMKNLLQSTATAIGGQLA